MSCKSNEAAYFSLTTYTATWTKLKSVFILTCCQDGKQTKAWELQKKHSFRYLVYRYCPVCAHFDFGFEGPALFFLGNWPVCTGYTLRLYLYKGKLNKESNNIFISLINNNLVLIVYNNQNVTSFKDVKQWSWNACDKSKAFYKSE